MNHAPSLLTAKVIAGGEIKNLSFYDAIHINRVIYRSKELLFFVEKMIQLDDAKEKAKDAITQ